VQRRGYRRSTVLLKDEDSKRHKSTKDVENKEKQTSEDQIKQKFSENVDTPENDQDAKLVDEATESTKETNSVEEASSGKEKRTRESKNQKTSEETTTRPAIISRNQALSLVANGNKSRLIITNHDHPETYPQCMALAMSGRPILPGFYSTSVLPLV
jgi:outer membrane biosynthesis protein TonB